MASLKHCQLCDEFTSTLPYLNWFDIWVLSMPILLGSIWGVDSMVARKHSEIFWPIATNICLSHWFSCEPRVSEASQTNSDGGSSDLDDGELDQPLKVQPSEPTPLDPSELKKAAATRILKVKEGHELPQSTMNSVLNDVTEFNRLLLQDLHSVVIQRYGQLV